MINWRLIAWSPFLQTLQIMFEVKQQTFHVREELSDSTIRAKYKGLHISRRALFAIQMTHFMYTFHSFVFIILLCFNLSYYVAVHCFVTEPLSHISNGCSANQALQTFTFLNTLQASTFHLLLEYPHILSYPVISIQSLLLTTSS